VLFRSLETETEHGDRGLSAYINGSANADDSVERMKAFTPAANPNPIAQPASNVGRLLASNCFQCHGTLGMGGFDRIRGDAGDLREYLNRPARSDIMAAHAQGYTPAQINAIVAYLNQN
jgi:mono/diheme cytochrome c family protein